MVLLVVFLENTVVQLDHVVEGTRSRACPNELAKPNVQNNTPEAPSATPHARAVDPAEVEHIAGLVIRPAHEIAPEPATHSATYEPHLKGG